MNDDLYIFANYLRTMFVDLRTFCEQIYRNVSQCECSKMPILS